jgi:L-threonylcarbamoyladenylate synthase
MPEIVDIRCADEPRDVVHRSCQLLAEGQLLLLPTETQYTLAASGLQVVTVERLAELAGNRGLELVARSVEDARDYWTSTPRIALKLARRCWPGPVVLALPEPNVGGLFGQLSETVRRHLIHSSAVHFRSPAHSLCADLQRYVPGPLICISDDDSPEFPRKSPKEIPPAWANNAALILDDGPCRYGDASTVVRVDDRQWTILSEGVVGSRHVARLAGEVYLFVCTGNTCRSPMAEAIFRKLLADR